MLKPSSDAHLFVGRLTVAELDLVDYARASAEKLLEAFPDVIFTSGRRDVLSQADAMASNVLTNRSWISLTYAPSAERDSLQSWVDANPAANTRALVSGGLAQIMGSWTDTQRKSISHHFSGQAFDVHPVAGPAGNLLKKAIKALPNLKHFFDSEGGLVIWHADFDE